MAQTMNVAELAFAVEYFLAPFTRETKGFREGAKQLNDLRYVVVVFAVFCATLGVEEVVASYEFEDLFLLSDTSNLYGRRRLYTIAAILQTSVLAPHFAPNITSGDLYCLV